MTGMDLPDFLLARIAEDEEGARAAINHTVNGGEHTSWHATVKGSIVEVTPPVR